MGGNLKNLSYFPCERNRYFYGKLLSVDDFESEQKYMNDKRRIINRFMHGCGVVCGLGVVAVNDDTVSLEAGLALDFAGREIIVEKPVLERLTDIEGFSEEEGADSYLYLCIDYSEYEKNPVYSVTGGSSGGQVCHNKIAEGFHIYLTGQEPEEVVGADRYYEEIKTVYRGSGIRISQVFPRYVKSGGEFEFRLIVENMGQKLPVSFGYELVFDCLKKDGKKWMKLIFDEREQERANRYEIPVMLQAFGGKDVKGTATVREGSFWLKVGDYTIVEEGGRQERTESVVRIVQEDIKQVVRRQYFEHAMHEIISQNYHQSIYLAKINLTKAGNAVVIEDVEQMPFGQYICSDVLSSICERASEEERKSLGRRLSGAAEIEKRKADVREKSESGFRAAEGTAVLELGIGGLAGQTFFSKPIVHGFGPGNIVVLTGLIYGDNERYLRCGASGIFEEACAVQGETAARIDREEGTFVVGIRLSEPTTAERVKIRWTAFRGGIGRTAEEEMRELYLKPDMVYLSLREDYTFEAVLKGGADGRVTWSVREGGGGMIDENGTYTAPYVPGVYEILAESAAYPGLKASAFAVVRDTHRERQREEKF